MKSFKDVTLDTVKLKNHPKKKSFMEGNLFFFGMIVSALDMFDFLPKKEHANLDKHYGEMCYDISPKLVKITYKSKKRVVTSKGKKNE